jgi:hypothetical protein
MRSIAGALLWQITWPYRRWLVAVGVYLIAAILVVHGLPADLRARLGPSVVSSIGHCLSIPLIPIELLLVIVFSLPAKTLKEEGFTVHMRVLPVRTSTLVAWPMVGGCVAVMAVWWIVAALVMRPAGIAAPLWWPAAAMGLFLAVFQALAWTPFAQRWLQASIMVSAFMIAFLAVGISLLFIGDRRVTVGDSTIAAVLFALMPLAYAGALSGVARARRGDIYDWQLWNRLVARAAARRPASRSPFSSAEMAQLWFEYRAQGWKMPFLAGLVVSFFAFLYLIEPALASGGIWNILGVLLGATLMVVALTGMSLGNMHDLTSRTRNATFVLTRPISTVSIVRSKILAAAVGSAAAWLIVPIFLSLPLLRPELRDPIMDTMRRMPVWKAVGLPILALALLVTLTWKLIVEGLWIGLTGRNWVAAANVCGVVIVWLVGTSLGYWIHFRPQVGQEAWAALPWIVGALVFCKLLVATWVIRSLDQSRLIGRSTMATMIVAWCLIVAGLFSAAWWFVPNQHWSASGAFAAAVLFVPFCRPLGAPLALAWNRHR